MSINVTSKGPVASIILSDNHHHNALGAADIKQFIGHLDTLLHNGKTRALIITNDGGKTFCAGASLAEFNSGEMNGELYCTLTRKLAELPIATIAAIKGNAYGGGSELALCCDFRIGTPSMRIFVPPARLGLCYPIQGIEHFVHRLGVNTTKRLLLSTEEFSGEQLLVLGYLTHLSELSGIDELALTMAQNLANKAPLAISTMKALCNDIVAGTLNHTEAQQLVDACNASQDLQEGLAATRDKRLPVFKGM